MANFAHVQKRFISSLPVRRTAGASLVSVSHLLDMTSNTSATTQERKHHELSQQYE